MTPEPDGPLPSDRLLEESPRIVIASDSIINPHLTGNGTALPKPSSEAALKSLDALVSCLVIAPLVVGVWRGCWGLMDKHEAYFPPIESYFLGVLVHVAFALSRSVLLARSAEDARSRRRRWRRGGRWTLERCLGRVYTVVFCLACILHWRGGWAVLDMVLDCLLPSGHPNKGLGALCATAALACAASALRATRNLLASPYFLVTDGKRPTYAFETRFRTQSSRETWLYVLDCIFSVGVVGSLVVFVWRGLWSLLDIYLYPDDTLRSNCASMVIGYGMVAITFGMQAPMRWMCSRLHGAPRLLAADLFHLFSFVATVNLWRGIWGLLEIYFLPESPLLSNWLTVSGCLALLMLLNCSNTVLVRGVYIDAEEPAGECVVFPCHYLRLFFHRERTKKRHKRILLAAAAAAAARKSEDTSASAPLAPLASLANEKV